MVSLVTLLALLPFYLLGAFPTGALVARLHGVDITAQGSGNVGATNVARVIGKKAGVITLVGDVCKGVLGVIVARWLFGADELIVMSGVAVVLGHCFSVPPYLKGGKGVATAIGVTLALRPLIALCAFIAFVLVVCLKRIVSMGSLVAALITPVVALLFHESQALVAGLAVIAGVVVARHRQNIIRLIEGREPQFSLKKGAEGDRAGA